MTNLDLYQSVSADISKIITEKYSSSFSRSILLVEPKQRKNIYNIYGFVRMADEIVDTFHDYPKKELLDKFVEDYHLALKYGISTNPILNAFCNTKKEYAIPNHLIDSFLNSMYMDLNYMKDLDPDEFKDYIYGSAEVVGVMCLYVFLNGNEAKIQELLESAKSFGSALQKVNFLRDFNADYHQLDRVYFPDVDFKNFNESDKKAIEKDIENDFEKALVGIKKLPKTSRFAVYLAYRYYHDLFVKITRSKPDKLFYKRFRKNNLEKVVLLTKMYLYKNLNLTIK